MATLDECEDYIRYRGADVAFCKGIVFRLKSIGISHEQILCAAMLSQSGASFDELFERFGRELSVLTTSIIKDNTVPKARREEAYVEQLQNAPWEAVLIKLCEISANLKIIKESELSKAKRRKLLGQNIHYLKSLRKNIAENSDKALGLAKLLDGANETLAHFGRPQIDFDL